MHGRGGKDDQQECQWWKQWGKNLNGMDDGGKNEIEGVLRWGKEGGWLDGWLVGFGVWV